MDDEEDDEGEIYRLKYRDAEGKTSIREIRIIRLEIGDTPGKSYIRAYCFSAGDQRTFRFDRIRALYLDQERIEDPLGHLTGRYESVPAEPMTASQLADQAALDEDEDVGKVPVMPSAPAVPLDIPKAKKRRKKFLVAAVIFGILGILSIPTIIWAIIYLLISGFLFLAWNGTKKMIKDAEIAQAESPTIEST